ncbi:MAG: cell wall hydrolase [Sphingomonadales bacterium]|nr:cell wall hydrolase [Sphingomonadales bacterium]MDE2568279.1 cell wall hydrolase [Sphingomonadales bacterium]
MSKKLRYASAISVAASLITILFSAEGSGAAAQVYKKSAEPAVQTAESDPQFIARPVVQPLPTAQTNDDASAKDATGNAAIEPEQPATLAGLVAETPVPDVLSDQMRCLAGAIYFESKGETLTGQLAVGRVVINRATSGRFPDSYCGVVYQHAQFSFVRHGAMPPINTGSHAWQTAVRIAQIAEDNAWTNPVKGALYFHAARLSPGWHRERLARIDNHVFYR